MTLNSLNLIVNIWYLSPFLQPVSRWIAEVDHVPAFSHGFRACSLFSKGTFLKCNHINKFSFSFSCDLTLKPGLFLLIPIFHCTLSHTQMPYFLFNPFLSKPCRCPCSLFFLLNSIFYCLLVLHSHYKFNVSSMLARC